MTWRCNVSSVSRTAPRSRIESTLTVYDVPVNPQQVIYCRYLLYVGVMGAKPNQFSLCRDLVAVVSSRTTDE